MMTTMHVPMNIDIVSTSTAPPSRLESSVVHRIEPDVEEVALILAKQRLTKSKAGTTIAKKAKMGSSLSPTQKRIKKTGNKATQSPRRFFPQRPLGPPPMLPTLRAGQIIPRRK